MTNNASSHSHTQSQDPEIKYLIEDICEAYQDAITVFDEKPQAREGWINGAFFVCEPQIFDYIEGDSTQFERRPLQDLARDGQLMAYRHYGFWQCMDTVRDKVLLEKLWDSGSPPWRIWE